MRAFLGEVLIHAPQAVHFSLITFTTTVFLSMERGLERTAFDAWIILTLGTEVRNLSGRRDD